MGGKQRPSMFTDYSRTVCWCSFRQTAIFPPQRQPEAAATARAHSKHDCVGEFGHIGGAQGRQMGYLGECNHQGGCNLPQGTGGMAIFTWLPKPQSGRVHTCATQQSKGEWMMRRERGNEGLTDIAAPQYPLLGGASEQNKLCLRRSGAGTFWLINRKSSFALLVSTIHGVISSILGPEPRFCSSMTGPLLKAPLGTVPRTIQRHPKMDVSLPARPCLLCSAPPPLVPAGFSSTPEAAERHHVIRWDCGPGLKFL